MEKDYTTVDDTLLESALDDAAQVPETGTDALSEALESMAPEPAVEAGRQGAEDKLQEPKDGGLRGRMKQFEKRGYNRAMREAESKWAERERSYQERLAKYEQMELEADAKEFAQKNNVPENFALEYMRMKRGLPAESEQQRDSAGRFTAEHASNEQAATNTAAQERAGVLMTQAEAFEKMSDGRVTRDDILNAFQGNAEMRQKVVSGEWDFTDVGRALSRSGQHRAPRVSRSASNGQIQNSTFMGMSDEDFAKFDERIRQGAVFDARR